MHTALFDYHLPEAQIAQSPASRRDQSRMLVVDRTAQTLSHHSFRDLSTVLRTGDLLVLNDTRVIPARIFATRIPTGGRVEFLLLEPTDHGAWEALMRASRRPAPGTRFDIGPGKATAELIADGENGRCTLRIESDRPLLELLDEVGSPPLPPYIRRDRGTSAVDTDRDRYQTIFAEEPGAVAAPTAGLHFTKEVFHALADQGVERTTLTLHVGIGTFRPVTVDRLEDHVMSEERFELTEATAQAIEATRGREGRVVAVGSTSVRTLETQASGQGRVRPGQGRTDLFIHPPYAFQVVDAMLTNFHLPRSTLLMMVCALAGREFMLHAYNEAVREGYRFYSYGDCMLIL